MCRVPVGEGTNDSYDNKVRSDAKAMVEGIGAAFRVEGESKDRRRDVERQEGDAPAYVQWEQGEAVERCW